MRHTRYGYWLEEAGRVEPTAPLGGDTTADVVVVGAGYLGLWTAWQLKQLEPALDVVVLEVVELVVEVADEAAGSRIMLFDRPRNGRGGVAEVFPRFAESSEVIIRVESFVRPG